MDFSRLLQLHQQGQLDEALQGYRQLIEAGQAPAHAYMNAAAILRQQGQPADGASLAQQGLRRFPREAGLWNNCGNCLRDAGQGLAALQAFRQALRHDRQFVDARLSLASALRQQQLPELAYATLLEGLRLSPNSETTERFYLPLVELLLAFPEERRGSKQSLIVLLESLERRGDPNPQAPGGHALVIGQVWMQLNELERALRCRDQAMEEIGAFFQAQPKLSLKKAFQTRWHSFNWNLGISLLREGNMREGWALYEHGLQVPAEGAQRWQRSLFKPFTPQQLPIWRGEPLAGKRLLLLGEQGIGDAMMFATLIPSLEREGAVVSVAPGDRLLSLYQRSLPHLQILSSKQLRNGSVQASAFDLQCPLGSIVQHRFHRLEDFAPHSPFLKADPERTAQLRRRYQERHPGKLLVGISWQGGGKPKRIKAKSIGLQELQPLISLPGIGCVSLQYGDDGPHLEKFRRNTGLDVLHDDSINPLKDMDLWHCQVAAMDAVISIANTTIHGAGGLGIPTLCLVSNQADWRWIKPNLYRGCYWYPSVDAVYQGEDGSWQEALQQAERWLHSRRPAAAA